jgi:hypothetical protein
MTTERLYCLKGLGMFPSRPKAQGSNCRRATAGGCWRRFESPKKAADGRECYFLAVNHRKGYYSITLVFSYTQSGIAITEEVITVILVQINSAVLSVAGKKKAESL